MECNKRNPLQALRRQNSGHLQNALIILLLFKLRASLAIDNERHLTVKLECGGGYRCGDWSLNGFGDGGGFGRATGEKENPLCLKNGPNAHGNGTLRDLFFSGKKLAVIFDGFFAEHFQASSRTQAGGRLIKSDVSVASNTENLQVNAPAIANGIFVRRTVLLII